MGIIINLGVGLTVCGVAMVVGTILMPMVTVDITGKVLGEIIIVFILVSKALEILVSVILETLEGLMALVVLAQRFLEIRIR